MRKLVRRSVQAALLAGGFVVVTAVGASAAPVADTVVANQVESDATSVAEHNGILSGNAISVPVNVPVVENQVSVAGIGAAINADDSEGALGILGLANTGLLGSGDGNTYAADTVVANDVDSDSTSVAEHNGIGSGNVGSVPVNVPVAENQVAVAGIGAAGNLDDTEAAAGLLGLGNTGLLGGGDGGNGYSTDPAGASSILDGVGLDPSSLGLGAIGQNDLGVNNLGTTGLGQGVVPLAAYGSDENCDDTTGGDSSGGWVDTAVWNDVDSSATSVAEHNGILSGNAISMPVNVPIVENQAAVAGIGGAINADDTEAALGLLGLGNTGLLGGGDGNTYAADTVVASDVDSDATSVAEHNGILSGNAISVPVNVPIAENQVSVAGIGAAGNLDDTEAALGLLGLGNTGGLLGGLGAPDAETLPAPVADTTMAAPNTYGGGHDQSDEGGYADTVVASDVDSDATSVAEHNGIASGNAISVPVNVPVAENQVAVAGIGAAVNGDDTEAALGLLGGLANTGGLLG